VPTGVPGKNVELPLTDVGESALVNEKLNELPGCTSFAGLFARNWIAKPSPGPMLVMLSDQPEGGLTEIGLVARKSSPGTQAYQNVPMPELLELAFVRVIVLLVLEPAAVELMTPLALIVAMRARPSRYSNPVN
jgi:hypothetical protein